MGVARHQQAAFSIWTDPETGALGYTLEDVPYGFYAGTSSLEISSLIQAHAAALGMLVLSKSPTTSQTKQAGRLAFALSEVAHGLTVSEASMSALRIAQPRDAADVLIRTDGSADKHGDAQGRSISLGYLLNRQPYAVLLRGVNGPEGLAEREAIRTALTHARLLGYTQFRVQSDHKFHTRRYTEDLIHRGRRKSDSLEGLDALVDELRPDIQFEYAPTLDSDAPHRLALHARALDRLAQGKTLSRAQGMALRRVHYALKVGGDVLY